MLFRQEVVDQAANNLEGEVLLLPKFSHKLIATLISLWVILVLLLLINGQFSRKETVLGWLSSSAGVVRVFNPSPDSVISEIYVSNGELINQGDKLFLVKTTKTLASGEEFTQSLVAQFSKNKQSLVEKKERVLMEFEERQASLAKQMKLAKAELSHLDSQLSTVSEHEYLMQEEFEKYRKLFEQKVISSVQYNKTNKELLNVRGNKQALERSKSQQKSLLSKLQSQFDLLPDQYKNKLSDIDSEINQVEQQLLQTKSQHEVVIKSPVTGEVNNLQVNLGQRVSQTIPLLNIVPKQSELIVNLLVPVRAVGFLEIDQNIHVRYSAFPYQKFGIYKAKVTAIPDSVLLPNEILNLPVEVKEPVYLVEAQLTRETITAYGREIRLKNGMSLSADVFLSERTIMEWLLEPLYSLTGRLK